ncbi:MAG: hypothetical protein K0S14_40 [Thermomicrobiales bacterium]|nr:hypothetical protein [Thermomicrobiales bacterium]
MTAELQAHIVAQIEKIREPLGLDRWSIQASTAELTDARATCSASPEYREATVLVDLARLQTGDDLDEILVHELTHPLTWPLHALAERYANMLADSLPAPLQEAYRKGLHEEVRLAGEQVTTDVGQALLRLFRRADILDNPAVMA